MTRSESDITLRDGLDRNMILRYLIILFFALIQIFAFHRESSYAGYALKYYICTSYRKPAALLPENEVFNVLFSTARVKIEHVNGILKARFTSLKGLRILVRQLEDFVRVNEWIVICIILYNILLNFKDEWPDDDVDQQEEEGEQENEFDVT